MPMVNGKWEPGPNDSHIDPKSGEVHGGLGKDEPTERLAALQKKGFEERAARLRAELEKEGAAVEEKARTNDAKAAALDAREAALAAREAALETGASVGRRNDVDDLDDFDDANDEEMGGGASNDGSNADAK